MCGYIKVEKRTGNSKRIDCRCYHADEYDPTAYNLKLPIGIELIDEGDIGDGLVLNGSWIERILPNEDYNYYYDYEFQDTFWDALSLIKDKDWNKF